MLAAHARRDRVVERQPARASRPPPSASRRRRAAAASRGIDLDRGEVELLDQAARATAACRRRAARSRAGSTTKPASSWTSCGGARAQPGLAAIAGLDDPGDELGQEQRRARPPAAARARDRGRAPPPGAGRRARARSMPPAIARVDHDDHRVLTVGPHDRVAHVRRATRCRRRGGCAGASRRIARKPPSPTRSSPSTMSSTTSSRHVGRRRSAAGAAAAGARAGAAAAGAAPGRRRHRARHRLDLVLLERVVDVERELIDLAVRPARHARIVLGERLGLRAAGVVAHHHRLDVDDPRVAVGQQRRRRARCGGSCRARRACRRCARPRRGPRACTSGPSVWKPSVVSSDFSSLYFASVADFAALKIASLSPL